MGVAALGTILQATLGLKNEVRILLHNTAELFDAIAIEFKP